MNDFMFKSEAKDFFDCLQYEEAKQRYDYLFEKNKSIFTKEDYINYIICLRMCNKNEKALLICKELYNHHELYENQPNFNQHNQLYAAILYDCYISNFENWAIQDENRFLSAVDKILAVVNQEQSFFYENAVFKALDYLSKKMIKDGKKMYSYLKRLDPSKLSSESLTYLDERGNVVEISGSKAMWEKYYKEISSEINSVSINNTN